MTSASSPSGHRVAMLGTGLIGDFYTMTLHGQRGRDRVEVGYSCSAERGAAFKERWSVPHATTSVDAAVGHPDVDTVVVGLPNHMHEERSPRPPARPSRARNRWPARPTRPSGLSTSSSRPACSVGTSRIVYTPKTLKALAAVRGGAIGDVM